MAAIRIGVIGCGGIATHHVERLAKMRAVKVAALVDPNAESLSRLQERVAATRGLPTFADYRKMLDKVKLDAVHINSPHTLHYPQITDSLDRGLHVLTEKPMVCTVAHAQAVVRKAKQKKRVLLVSYQRHYAGPWRYARELVQKGALGSVQYVDAMLAQNWLPITSTWRGDPALSGGGQLNDSGSHLVDILLWITGLRVREVSAFIENRGARVDIDSAVAFRFEKDAVGTLSVLGASPGWRESLTIWGSKGVISLGPGPLTLQTYSGPAQDLTAKAKDRGNPDKNFIDAILGRAENAAPGECGLRVIELTEAAWRSAATGQTVTVR